MKADEVALRLRIAAVWIRNAIDRAARRLLGGKRRRRPGPGR